MSERSPVTTFLFTDIEGSSRLWETDPSGMQPALARHDALARQAVGTHGGSVVKMTGDGVCAAFDDPLGAVLACLDLQLGLDDVVTSGGAPLRVRCGMHLGVVERRDNDYFGNPVNRAARIMSAAHGGQVLLSQAVVDLVRDRLPAELMLKDLGDVRLKDLASSERIHQLLHPRLRHDFPPLRSLAGTPNNLPQQVTSFVGRERELATARAMLAKTRLLTLHGAGGIGKTRLSLQLAGEVLDDYPEGVWFVELAPLGDERLVAQAVATTVGLKEEPGRSIADALVDYLAGLHVLLVLDNCEHLVGACATLCHRLMRDTRHLRIVASSREPLHVAGEAVFPVPVLALPELASDAPPRRLAQVDAVRLFLDRAAQSMPSFVLDEHTSSPVVDICRRLDGIPLAIELAAARMRTLSVATIAGRLGDRFRLLTTGSRTALPRQQTLRALIDWSLDLLTPNERVVFARLAVFAGGFTLDAAEGVCEGRGVERADILDLLSELAEKSLLVVEAEGARYRLLETMREYARERLAASGEMEGLRSRHLDYYLALAEDAASRLSGERQAEALARLDADRENLIGAHVACASVPDGARKAYRLVAACKLYWFIRGLLYLGHRMTEVALAIPPGEPASTLRCRALWVGGQISSYSGRYEEALGHLREALAIAEHHGDQRMIASIENVLSLAALGLGDRHGARGHCERALGIARELGSEREIAVASNALAQLHRLDGDLESAAPLYDEVVTIGRRLRDQEFIAIGLLGLAMVEIGRRDVDRSRVRLREALTIARATGSNPAQQSALDVGAGHAALTRDYEGCARLYGAAQAQMLRAGIRRDPADEAFLAPWLEEARSALGTRFAELATEGGGAAFEATVVALDARLAPGTS